MIEFTSAFFFLWALLVMVMPLHWLAAAAAAAMVHEACHLAAICLLGGRICHIQIGILGAVIETQGIGGIREAVCALAGPAGSFLLVGFIRAWPVLGLCGLVQGCFNLLPVYPLDGGRVLRRLTERLWAPYAATIALAVEYTVLAGGLFCTFWLLRESSAGLFAAGLWLMAAAGALLRKKP